MGNADAGETGLFSLEARRRFIERGWSTRSLVAFLRDSALESVGHIRGRRELVRAIWAFGLGFTAVAAVAISPLFSGDHDGLIRFFAWSFGATVVLTGWVCLHVDLFRRPDGSPVSGLGLANRLTLARFYLIAPVVILLAGGHYPTAIAAYAALGITDIADGVIARRTGSATRFGVIMDPLADVLSTAAIYGFFAHSGYIPGWLFAILIVRYGMLVVGSVAFFLAVGPIEFRSTAAGKVVGVIQAAGAILIIVGAATGSPAATGRWLFPFLGAAFGSIVVSQTFIARRERRRIRAR